MAQQLDIGLELRKRLLVLNTNRACGANEVSGSDAQHVTDRTESEGRYYVIDIRLKHEVVQNRDGMPLVSMVRISTIPP